MNSLEDEDVLKFFEGKTRETFEHVFIKRTTHTKPNPTKLPFGIVFQEGTN